jgi:hypothetical protein
MTSFQDKELEILRSAVDKAENRSGRELIHSPDIQKIIQTVETFLRKKKLVCYGGTAINNILPTEDQFYNKNIEIPDYDFFSMNALEDAKELADIYAKEGYNEIEAKSGVHMGTYKVFVNYIPVADITHLDKEIYKNVFRESISVSGIKYAPPNYLRMSMYLELSRPRGDVGRWEKVLKRLTLLNKNYPLKGFRCHEIDFQREMNLKHEHNIHDIVKQSLINQGVIFFGGFANALYSKYMPKRLRKQFMEVPDFDVLSTSPKTTAMIVKERLNDEGIHHVQIIKHKNLGEIIAEHYEIRIGKETVCFIYEPLACHSYNVIVIKRNKIKIATIDTMLSFYLAFLYSDRPYYDDDRILCMCEFLFKVQQKNRLEQKGLLRRFSISCYGKQHTLDDSRSEKALMFKKLKRGTPDYEKWFLKYNPNEGKEKTNTKHKKTRKHKNSKNSKNSKKLKKTRKYKKYKKGRKFGGIEF